MAASKDENPEQKKGNLATLQQRQKKVEGEQVSLLIYSEVVHRIEFI